jgi:hypothetical protein
MRDVDHRFGSSDGPDRDRPLLDGSDSRDALLSGLLFSVHGLVDQVRELRDRCARLEAAAFCASVTPLSESDR